MIFLKRKEFQILFFFSSRVKELEILVEMKNDTKYRLRARHGQA
jgi:hypothetical protein